MLSVKRPWSRFVGALPSSSAPATTRPATLLTQQSRVLRFRMNSSSAAHKRIYFGPFDVTNQVPTYLPCLTPHSIHISSHSPPISLADNPHPGLPHHTAFLRPGQPQTTPARPRTSLPAAPDPAPDRPLARRADGPVPSRAARAAHAGAPLLRLAAHTSSSGFFFFQL